MTNQGVFFCSSKSDHKTHRPKQFLPGRRKPDARRHHRDARFYSHTTTHGHTCDIHYMPMSMVLLDQVYGIEGGGGVTPIFPTE